MGKGWMNLTRLSMRADVEACFRYYNQKKLLTSNDECSPIEFEQFTINSSYAA